MPRWTVNCFATVETLTPLERAVRIASTSCSVSGVRDRLIGSVTASLSAKTIGSTGERTSPTPRFHAEISLSTTRRLFPQRSLRPTQLLLSELQPTLAGPSERAASVVSEPALVGDACEGFVEFGADLVWAEEDPGEDGPVELLSYCRGCVRVGGVCVL